eukprot:10753849-Karenia_brevis.AAC.1
MLVTPVILQVSNKGKRHAGCVFYYNIWQMFSTGNVVQLTAVRFYFVSPQPLLLHQLYSSDRLEL